MTSSQLYQLNAPDVIQDVIDEEAIIINLKSGKYYSLTNSGAIIWDMLIKKVPIPDIKRNLETLYTDSENIIGDSVEPFIDELLQEGLVVNLLNESELSKNSTKPDSADKIHSDDNIVAFEMPKLHIYTDMEELLLLDPIHEVDNAGWPVKKDDGL